MTEDLRRFAVRVDGDDVLIALGDGAVWRRILGSPAPVGAARSC